MDLEKHLHRNGTRIVKFYLHLSKDEQRKRFLQRIDEPNKNWKFSLADIEERKFWKRYMSAFEECLSATSTREAPWYVVPADDKENARLIVSQIILDTLDGLEMTYPEVGAQRQQELQSIRERMIGGDLDRTASRWRGRTVSEISEADGYSIQSNRNTAIAECCSVSGCQASLCRLICDRWSALPVALRTRR